MKMEPIHISRCILQTLNEFANETNDANKTRTRITFAHSSYMPVQSIHPQIIVNTKTEK